MEDVQVPPVSTGMRSYLSAGFLIRFVIRILYLVLAWKTLRLYWVYGGEISFLGMLGQMIIVGPVAFKLYEWLYGYLERRSQLRLLPCPEGPDWSSPAWRTYFAAKDQLSKTLERQRKTLLTLTGLCFWLLLFAAAHIFSSTSGWAIDGRPMSFMEFVGNPDAHRLIIVVKGFSLEGIPDRVEATTKDGVKVVITHRIHLVLIQEYWAEVERRNDLLAIKKAARAIFRDETQALIARHTFEELKEPFFFEFQLSRTLKEKFNSTGYRFVRLDMASVDKPRD